MSCDLIFIVLGLFLLFIVFYQPIESFSPGTLIQLAAKGPQDDYLTVGNAKYQYPWFYPWGNLWADPWYPWYNTERSWYYGPFSPDVPAGYYS